MRERGGRWRGGGEVNPTQMGKVEGWWGSVGGGG